MNWYLMAWQNFAQFEGRSRRKEYWIFTLVNLLIFGILYIGGFVMLGRNGFVATVFLGLCALYSLAQLVPALACATRRLHDTGRSGWWILLAFVPVINLALIVLLALDSEPGDNQYGPNPKYVAQSATIG